MGLPVQFRETPVVLSPGGPRHIPEKGPQPPFSVKKYRKLCKVLDVGLYNSGAREVTLVTNTLRARRDPNETNRQGAVSDAGIREHLCSSRRP